MVERKIREHFVENNILQFINIKAPITVNNIRGNTRI